MLGWTDSVSAAVRLGEFTMPTTSVVRVTPLRCVGSGGMMTGALVTTGFSEGCWPLVVGGGPGALGPAEFGVSDLTLLREMRNMCFCYLTLRYWVACSSPHWPAKISKITLSGPAGGEWRRSRTASRLFVFSATLGHRDDFPECNDEKISKLTIYLPIVRMQLYVGSPVDVT